MSKDDAISVLTDSYIKQFGYMPDQMMEMAIKISAERVADGERFEWKNHPENGKMLQFIP